MALVHWLRRPSLRYYADLEKKRCPEFNSNISVQNCTDMNACIVWRRFAKWVKLSVGYNDVVHQSRFILHHCIYSDHSRSWFFFSYQRKIAGFMKNGERKTWRECDEKRLHVFVEQTIIINAVLSDWCKRGVPQILFIDIVARIITQEKKTASISFIPGLL